MGLKKAFAYLTLFNLLSWFFALWGIALGGVILESLIGGYVGALFVLVFLCAFIWALGVVGEV